MLLPQSVIIEGQEQTNMHKNYEHPTQALDMSNLFKHKLRHVYMKIRSDVISKALKLLVEWEEGYQNWVEETRQKVEVAAEQLDRGEGIANSGGGYFLVRNTFIGHFKSRVFSSYFRFRSYLGSTSDTCNQTPNLSIGIRIK
jgi:hypothetical protein